MSSIRFQRCQNAIFAGQSKVPLCCGGWPLFRWLSELDHRSRFVDYRDKISVYLKLTNSFAVVPMLGYLYWQDQGGEIPTVQSDIMKGTLNVGMAVGQLMFGVLGDALGRHKVYGKELLITLFGTLMVILLPWNNSDKQSIVAWIACFRVVTGIGIGAG